MFMLKIFIKEIFIKLNHSDQKCVQDENYCKDYNYSDSGSRVRMSIFLHKTSEEQAATSEWSSDIQLFLHRSHKFLLLSRLLLCTTVEIWIQLLFKFHLIFQDCLSEEMEPNVI